MGLLSVGYAGVFALAAAAYFASASRASKLDNPDAERGLVGLLVASGAWAGVHVGRFLSPSPALKLTFYLIALTVGLVSVGAWLYFCSAYTGHDYHRRPAVRQTALVVFLVIMVLKLANPIHGEYFAVSAYLYTNTCHSHSATAQNRTLPGTFHNSSGRSPSVESLCSVL